MKQEGCAHVLLGIHNPWVLHGRQLSPFSSCLQRNYRTFLLFVYNTTVLCLYVFGCSLAQIFVRHRELVNDAHARGESGDGL